MKGQSRKYVTEWLYMTAETYQGRVRCASRSSCVVWCICRWRRQRRREWGECITRRRCVEAWNARHRSAVVTWYCNSRTRPSTNPAVAAAAAAAAYDVAGCFPLKQTPISSAYAICIIDDDSLKVELFTSIKHRWRAILRICSISSLD